jgi:outer membrane protein OmpA-like peptidoglycan-associated protein
MRTTYMTVTALSLVLFVGCSRQPHPAVETAKIHLQEVRQDPQVATGAPLLLNEAENNVEKAARAWRKDHDEAEVNHLVYLAERQMATAREKTSTGLANATTTLSAQETALRANELKARSAQDRAMSNIVIDHYQTETRRTQAQVAALRSELTELKAIETKRGHELSLSSDVLFASNEAELKPGALLKLQPIIDFLRNHPAETALIEGHTDSVGGHDYNVDLSNRRAAAVRNLFIQQGISSDRLNTTGMGESYPVASNNSDAGRLQNRRVQIVFAG